MGVGCGRQADGGGVWQADGGGKRVVGMCLGEESRE